MSSVANFTFWYFGIFIALLFIAGLYYLIATQNLIRALIALEILIKAATLLIILAGFLTGRVALAQSLVITLIVIEVVIMVVAAGVILSVYRFNKSVDTRKLTNLKG